MITIGSIGFMQPWILAALVALPAIWWLLRMTPPSPQVVVFPPTRLLKDLESSE
jgi:Aerotolerance regulator N-terminal